MPPKHGDADVLSNAPKCKRLEKKTHALDKLLSGMSFSAVVQGFKVNDSTLSTKEGALKGRHT